MAPSLMMYTKEYLSDNAKGKAKAKPHQTALRSTTLRTKTATRK